jgi:hypothetical protein
MTASTRLICRAPLRLKQNINSNIESPNITNESLLAALSSIIPGAIKPGIASTANKLKMFEPMILPKAKSSSPLSTPAMLAANSGKLVPIAIIVSPITKSLIPKCFAITTAESTRKCALNGKIIIPTTTQNTAVLVATLLGNSVSVSAISGSFFPP